MQFLHWHSVGLPANLPEEPIIRISSPIAVGGLMSVRRAGIFRRGSPVGANFEYQSQRSLPLGPEKSLLS